MEDEKKGYRGPFRGFYITAFSIFTLSASFESAVGVAIGFFMIIFTGLAHLILKVVGQQDGMHEIKQSSPDEVIESPSYAQLQDAQSSDNFWSGISEPESFDENLIN